MHSHIHDSCEHEPSVQARRAAEEAGQQYPPGPGGPIVFRGGNPNLPPQLQHLLTARDEAELHQMLDTFMASLQGGMDPGAQTSSLQYRNITEADYELLSQLDEGVARPHRRPITPEELSCLPIHIHHDKVGWQFCSLSAVIVAAAQCCITFGYRLTLFVCMQGAKGSSAQSCSICLEAFLEGSMVTTLPCLHAFDTDCIEPWLQQNGNHSACPVCKEPVFGSEQRVTGACQLECIACDMILEAHRRACTMGVWRWMCVCVCVCVCV